MADVNFQNRPDTLDREKQARERREAVRASREANGWTQSEISARVGISQSKLSLYEKGAVELTSKELKAIESLLSGKVRRKPLVKSGHAISLRELVDPAIRTKMDRKRRLWKAGISQQALAKALGTYRTKITEWVNGKITLTAEEEAKLDEILNEANVDKKMADPYFLLESAYASGSKLWFELKQLKEKFQILGELVESYREQVKYMKEIIGAHEEWGSERDAKIAELEARIAEYRDLLGLETDAVVSRSQADEKREELREKVTKKGVE
jgi:transcriptional regulator with XRE-family HTH domain